MTENEQKNPRENRLLRVSIPVKILMITGLVYGLFWLLGNIAGHLGADFSREAFGVTIGTWYWMFEVLMAAVTASISSYRLLDRPLFELTQAIHRLEQGDVESLTQTRVPIQLSEFASELRTTIDRVRTESTLRLRTENVSHEDHHHRLSKAVQDLSVLYDIGQQINSVVDLDKLYTILTDSLRRSLSIDEFAVMVFDDRREAMHVRSASGFADDEKILRTSFYVGEGISGLAAQKRKKMYIRDTSKEPRFLHYKGEKLSRSSSFLSIPLIYKDEVLGVINYGRSQIGSFSTADVRLLSLVANQVALSIANAKLYTKTRELSVKDELTGIYNRRHFQHMLQIEWKRAVRFRRDLSLVMIDVDHFKRYNDTHGHLKGDQVLKSLGQLLMINLREVDTVARFGGEEFVLLLPDTDKRGAIAVAEKVRRIVRERMPMEDSAEDTKITISGGIAHYPDDVKDMEDLIDHADIALYRAKEQGRDQVVCFAPPKPKVADEAEPQQVIPTLLAAKKKFFTTMQ